MAHHWPVEDNVISVDFKKVPSDEALREQAKSVLARDPASSEMAPCVAPDKDAS